MQRFNEQNEVIQQEDYKAILVGLAVNEDISYYMEELWGLAEAAGIEVAGQMVQAKDRPDSATYIGKGKVEELALMCEALEADTVIFNKELSGMQIRNLEDKLGVRVIDRTILILDIFADRAVSREGKLQVELAQLQYRMPRLTGFGKSLSRLGGGIGTRGPGEKKLETDRRHIERRMDEIKREMEEVKGHRKTQRQQREKSGIPVVAIVGYTNAGKSALMNRFLETTLREDKVVLEKDMLFATLDTFQRHIKLATNHEFVLIDTVGFVSNLPHSLVKAFKATLEEVTYADLLLHVVDTSYDNYDFHMQVTDQVLVEIGAGQTEKLTVFNKIDLLDGQNPAGFEGPNSIPVSAKEGTNLDRLTEMIKERLFGNRFPTRLLAPYSRGDIVSDLQNRYEVSRLEYQEDGVYLEVELSLEDYQRLEAFRTRSETV